MAVGPLGISSIPERTCPIKNVQQPQTKCSVEEWKGRDSGARYGAGQLTQAWPYFEQRDGQEASKSP